MLKPRPLFPGPRPPYLEAYVKTVASKVEAHLSDTDDPHETLKKVPLVYAGTVPPAADPKFKDTDLYVDTTAGVVYRMQGGTWTELNLKGVSKPMSGEIVPLDTDNDLYGAVHRILERLGATVP